jgi:YfiH family protein
MCQDIVIVQKHNVFAGFTTRPSVGAQRRVELAKTAAEHGGAAVRLSLVHGRAVAEVTLSEVMRAQDGIIDYEDTDAAITDQRNVVLTSGHGDCLPVYLYDPTVPAIGLAHAGWRGTLKNIASATARSMVRKYSCKPKNLRAWIGPGIGRCCFEVSADVAQAFYSTFAWSSDYIDPSPDGKFHIDLKGINHRQLSDCGIAAIESSDFCTVCRSDLFYSYRRNREQERMLAYIYLKGDCR